MQNVFIGIVTTAYDKARAGTEAYLGTNASGELAVYEGFPRFLGRMIVYSLYCAVWVIKQAASRTERSSQLGMKRMISAKTNARKAAWSWRSRKRGTGAQDEQAAGALTVEPPATDSAAEDAMLSPRPDWSGNPEAMVARAFGSKQESVGTAKVHPLPHSESSNLSARKLRRFMTKDQLMEERSKKPSWFSWKDGFKAFMLCASSKAGTVYDLISAPHDTPYIDSSDRMYLITVGELTRLFRREDLRHRPLSFWGYRWEYFPGVVGFEETLLRLLGTAEVDHMPPALAHIAEGSGAGPPTPGPGPSSSSKVEPESLPATGEPSRKEGSVTKIAW
ncbi:unnamed protein product [Pedinophyceae sp. YPF-701]|nr:unnamed protein product [Pedinophyceae sp. YPF-701]